MITERFVVDRDNFFIYRWIYNTRNKRKDKTFKKLAGLISGLNLPHSLFLYFAGCTVQPEDYWLNFAIEVILKVQNLLWN